MATNLFFARVRFGPLIDRFLKAAAFGATVVLLWTPPALARGGGGHGMGGFGLHGGGRMQDESRRKIDGARLCVAYGFVGVRCG